MIDMFFLRVPLWPQFSTFSFFSAFSVLSMADTSDYPFFPTVFNCWFPLAGVSGCRTFNGDEDTSDFLWLRVDERVVQ